MSYPTERGRVPDSLRPTMPLELQEGEEERVYRLRTRGFTRFVIAYDHVTLRRWITALSPDGRRASINLRRLRGETRKARRNIADDRARFCTLGIEVGKRARAAH